MLPQSSIYKCPVDDASIAANQQFERTHTKISKEHPTLYLIHNPAEFPYRKWANPRHPHPWNCWRQLEQLRLPLRQFRIGISRHLAIHCCHCQLCVARSRSVSTKYPILWYFVAILRMERASIVGEPAQKRCLFVWEFSRMGWSLVSEVTGWMPSRLAERDKWI